MLTRPALSFGSVLVLTAAIILVWQLMVPPVPGMADNGDFGKVLGRFGMGSGAGFEFANTKYSFQDRYRYHSGFQSSELLLVVPALAINRIFSRDGSFDLRIMGAVHAALFLLAVFLVARRFERRWFGLLVLLLFCDLMYAGYFNSFYMDTAALLFTLLAAVFYVRAIRRPSALETAGLLISMVMAIAAKSQYAILAPWFALLFWTGRRILCGGNKGKAAVAVAMLFFTAWISYSFLAPESYRAKTAFTVIFNRVVPQSQNPGQALAELGLDQSYGRWIGMNAYLPGTMLDDATFYRPFLSKTSLLKIAEYYWRHPADAWRALRLSLDEGGRFEPEGGNFDSSSGKPPGAQSQSFQLASNLKRRLFHYHGGRLFFCFVGGAVLTVVMLMWNRQRLPAGAVSGGIVLAAMTAVTFIVSALADVHEQARHQLVSFALLDMLLLTMVWLIAEFRPLRVPGQLIVLLAACAIGAGCFLYRPLSPPLGEVDDYYSRIARFAIWNVLLFVGIRLLLRPLKTPRAPSYFYVASAVCVCLTGWLVYRITPVTAGLYDDFDYRVRFAAEWSRDNQFTAASGHSLTYTNVPNAGFRLAFRGSEISWVYTKSANRGIAAVFVDGNQRGEVDLYSPETEWQQRSMFPASGNGSHVFEVRILDRKNPLSSDKFVDLDALIVR